MFERGIGICHETVRNWWNRLAPLLTAAHALIHSHFDQDRDINRRDIFKQNRAVALAEWRQLAA